MSMSGDAESDLHQRRRGRNLAVLAALLGLAALLFIVTIVKLGENAVSPFVEFFSGRGLE